MTSIINAVKSKLGELGWGALVVFIIFRFNDLASMFYKFYMGHLLPNADYGALDPVYAAATLFSIPAVAIFMVATKSISRLDAMGMQKEKNALIADLLRMTFAGSVVAFIATFVFQSIIINRLHLSGQYSYILFLVVLLMWWQPMAMAIFQGERNYTLLALNALFSAIVLIFASRLLVVNFGFGLHGAFLAKIISGCVVLVILTLSLNKLKRNVHADYQNEKTVMRETLIPIMIYQACIVALFHSDKLFVRNFLCPDSGGYGAIATLGSIPAYFINAMSFVVFPLASADHAEGKTMVRYYKQTIMLCFAVMITCSGTFYYLAPIIIKLWNTSFSAYAGYVWIYSAVMSIHGVIVVFASIEIASHRYKFLWFMAPASLVTVIILYLFRAQLTIPVIISCLFVVNVFIASSLIYSATMRYKNAQ
ncbi:MAG: hypothetical protein A2283_01115 [Lentisphaerae bacterium RIFOXYA12_FULL_48_11]|nr:MAG: hypothetical protein A2283_01115 [Lentisphaerae bacterium RIFOXYA12_FULL_48_11]